MHRFRLTREPGLGGISRWSVDGNPGAQFRHQTPCSALPLPAHGNVLKPQYRASICPVSRPLRNHLFHAAYRPGQALAICLQTRGRAKGRGRVMVFRRHRSSLRSEFAASVWPGCNFNIFVVNHASSQINGAVMACAARGFAWWDRDVDRTGRPIRPDVRSAGHEIWEQACQRTHILLADHEPAAELMEYTVAQVSRYLDRIAAPLSTRKHGLLLVAFCRALRHYAAKSRRLKFAGGSGDLTNHTADNAWVRQVNARLDLASIVRLLSERNAAVLTLRAAEYEWKEIAQLFGVSASAIRNAFWREIGRIRRETRST
jgi:DNA-directed RNA polymerase specialized sigma24 family protein